MTLDPSLFTSFFLISLKLDICGSYSYSTLSIYLARVELVKRSEMLEKVYITWNSDFGGFYYTRDPCAIHTQSVYPHSDESQRM